MQVSIHALARSATMRNYRIRQNLHSFNPRTRAECDKVLKTCCYIFRVSIHALARSATYALERATDKGKGFNPRTRAECDINITGCVTAPADGFNPRTRAECDPALVNVLQNSVVSIHALARSATYKGSL